jgi:hypothetical protein
VRAQHPAFDLDGISARNTTPAFLRLLPHAIDASVSFADLCKRPMSGNLDCLVFRIDVREITFDTRFTINFIVSITTM